MTFGPERCVIDGVTHGISSSGEVGGSTDCELLFRWIDVEERFGCRADAVFPSRPVATTKHAHEVTCFLCIGH